MYSKSIRIQLFEYFENIYEKYSNTYSEYKTKMIFTRLFVVAKL